MTLGSTDIPNVKSSLGNHKHLVHISNYCQIFDKDFINWIYLMHIFWTSILPTNMLLHECLCHLRHAREATYIKLYQLTSIYRWNFTNFNLFGCFFFDIWVAVQTNFVFQVCRRVYLKFQLILLPQTKRLHVVLDP